MSSILRVWLLVGLACACGAPDHASAAQDELAAINARMAGRIVDCTHNHGADRRIESRVLCQRRDLYVYLPPCYDPARCYPLVVWCHGAFGDEHAFLDTAQIDYLDRLIRCGAAPPMIVVCADGTIKGEDRLLSKHSFYVNGCSGRFQDHLLDEVLPLVIGRYSIDPDRSRHAIVGVSAGGFGALGIALKHRDCFAYAVSHAGAINMRYDNLNHAPLEDFSPCTYRWKDYYRPRQVIGRFACIPIRAKMYVKPVFGSGPEVIPRVTCNNPADLLLRTAPLPGELDVLLSYGDEDNLNFDAHAQSFAHLARSCPGVRVYTACYPGMGHSLDYFRQSNQYAWRWLGQRMKADPPAAANIAQATAVAPEASAMDELLSAAIVR
ncbi:alpha/beta hydrolase-fold protein [Pirellulimonas nuda]|uniref:alpha/beta hydrolase-fold protein n=1 Tax=Pirellulimonas nuda TaxID=2528009 RepID=UPI0018D3DD67|nr:alpha/beta hydrolase-fold protein [Pirellulimonas nuda]